jgi:hypothetical protein
MTGREIPPLPISLIPLDVAPPPTSTTEKRPPTPIQYISTEDTEGPDELVVERESEPDVVNETTVNLVDGDGTTVTEIDIPDAAPLTADLLNNTMSLKQLKDRCVELGLATAGKKIDLAERIMTASPS